MNSDCEQYQSKQICDERECPDILNYEERRCELSKNTRAEPKLFLLDNFDQFTLNLFLFCHPI